MPTQTNAPKRSYPSGSQQLQYVINDIVRDTAGFELENGEFDESPSPPLFATSNTEREDSTIPDLHASNRAIPCLDGIQCPPGYCNICIELDEEMRRVQSSIPMNGWYYSILRQRVYQHNQDHDGGHDHAYPHIPECNEKAKIGAEMYERTRQTKDTDMDDFFDFETYEREGTVEKGGMDAPAQPSKVKKTKFRRSQRNKKRPAKK